MQTLFRLFGALVAWVVGSVLGVRRRHVVESMQHAGIEEPGRTATRMYRGLGRGLGELLSMAVSPRRPLDEVQLDLERLGSLRGRGFVVATAHTGNWDLVACAAAAHVPLTIVTKRLSIGLFDRWWQGARRARGVRLVAAGEATQAARRALAQGEAVAMLVDQAPERRRATIVTPFLGRPARVDLAPALVAARAKAPLVAAFPRRTPDGGHAFDVAAVIEPPPHAGRAWAEEAMRSVTTALDDFVRRHPEQWLWMHRRWKDAT